MKRLIILIFPLCLISLLLLCSCNEKEKEGTLLPKYDISCSVESDFSRIYVTENVDIYVDLTEPVSALPFRMDSLRYEKNDMGAYFESERDKFSGGETLFGGVSVNGIDFREHRNFAVIRTRSFRTFIDQFRVHASYARIGN